jgi:hypothetical protein
MTLQQTHSHITETDVFATLAKLNTWAQHLSPSERASLEALLVRVTAANQEDVEGFLMKAQPYEPGLRPVPSPDSGPGGAGGLSAGGGFMIQPYQLPSEFGSFGP